MEKHKEEIKWCSMKYLWKISDSVNSLFPKHLRPAFSSPYNLRSAFLKCKDKLDFLRRSGVYKLACQDCNSVYVGSTGRKFMDRMKEHRRAFIRNMPEKSNFAKHLIEFGHWSDFEIVPCHFASKGRYLDTLECLEIFNYKRNRDVDLMNHGLGEVAIEIAIYKRTKTEATAISERSETII
ncbi:hypothetical protein J437_LFUL018992 [Ladona fulva]|uniref:GIY-YIG domain-containing protein n=1 Tax=Ladona fulva TaxID=123851 RepID=A0A8K0KQK9_LADFU|nr:hypothetical protein J437_LFUL018992 [Ladona fulva]